MCRTSNFVAVEEPAVAVVMFSVLALVGFITARRLRPDLQRLATIFARTCLIIVDMSFWIGSLWGSETPIGHVPGWTFSTLWAIGLVGTLLWGAFTGQLFVVNAAASFGAIHFYTQWFEIFGADPFSLFAGGVIGLALALTVPKYNRYLRRIHSIS